MVRSSDEDIENRNITYREANGLRIMINGAHFLVYSTKPEADQEALRDVLESRSVSAEDGRLILELPPAEIATHTSTVESTNATRVATCLGSSCT